MPANAPYSLPLRPHTASDHTPRVQLAMTQTEACAQRSPPGVTPDHPYRPIARCQAHQGQAGSFTWCQAWPGFHWDQAMGR